VCRWASTQYRNGSGRKVYKIKEPVCDEWGERDLKVAMTQNGLNINVLHEV
jgi:hypothetical protein